MCTDFLFWGFFFCLNKCYRLKKDKIAELYGMVRLCLALEEIAKRFVNVVCQVIFGLLREAHGIVGEGRVPDGIAQGDHTLALVCFQRDHAVDD